MLVIAMGSLLLFGLPIDFVSLLFSMAQTYIAIESLNQGGTPMDVTRGEGVWCSIRGAIKSNL